MKKLTNEQLAWAAGIMDGEGSFMLSYRPPTTDNPVKAKWGTNRTGIYPRRTGTYVKICSVPNTQLKLLRLFKSWFGGSIATVKMPEDTNQKQLYVWRLTSAHEVKHFTESIKPYLFLKRRHAEIFLEFYTTVQERFSGKLITPEIRELRAKLHAEIKILNRRGRAAAETKRKDGGDAPKR